jgi:hypothetical protein
VVSTRARDKNLDGEGTGMCLSHHPLDRVASRIMRGYVVMTESRAVEPPNQREREV